MRNKTKHTVVQNTGIEKNEGNKFLFNPEYIVLCLVILMVFIYSLKRLYSPDIGFHLQAGEWMLKNMKIMKTDVFTYTLSGSKYIDLNWLYQVTMYSVSKWFTTSGLVIFNSLLITLSFLLLLLRMRIRMMTGYHLAAILMIIGLQALPLETRPHVFSWLFLNLVLLVLELYEYRKINRLFWLPVIMVIWINVHSLAILGLVVIGIYIAGSFLKHNKFDRVLVRYFLFSIGAFLINPYFIEGAIYPFYQFTLLTGGFEKQYITELQSPFNLIALKEAGFAYVLKPGFWLFVVMTLCLVACYKLAKTRSFTPLLICLGFLLIVSLAVKNYGYFLFATLPYLVEAFQSAIKTIIGKGKPVNKAPSFFARHFSPQRVFILTGSLAFVITITTITDGYGILTESPYRFGVAVDERQLPVKAVEFLVTNKIHGKIFNHLDFGGYLDHFYKEKTFIDGRLEVFGKEGFEEYFKYRTDEDGLKDAIQKYHPDIIIFPYLKATNWWASMIQDPDWKVIYADNLAAIYVPTNMFPHLTAVTEQSLMQPVSQYQPDMIPELLKLEKPSRAQAFLKGFISKQDEMIDYENLSMYCFTVGYVEAALAYSAAVIDQATVSPSIIYFNLYQYYQKQGDLALANRCLQKSGRKI